MKAIILLFDSLNKNYLPPYGDLLTKAPNFQRLAAHAATFDNSYVGSMPCMPARRELHTGRYNFLHRAWGPLEPFDDSMPELLKKAGIYTHLISDHLHYWEDGGGSPSNDAIARKRRLRFVFVERAVLPEWAARQRSPSSDRPPDRVLRPRSYSGYGSYRRRLPSNADDR